MSRQDIPSPSSQSSWEDIVETFPAVHALPFFGLSKYWESIIVTLRWRNIHSYSQDELRRERIKAPSLSNRKSWQLVLTILCFLSFVVLFTKGLTRHLALIPTARPHFAHLNCRGNVSAPLVDFQISPPVNVPADADCKVTFMEHSFGNSYGAPFVGE
jgi:hypothetical protein